MSMAYILYYAFVSSSSGKVAKVIKMRNSFTGLLITKHCFAHDKYLVFISVYLRQLRNKILQYKNHYPL